MADKHPTIKKEVIIGDCRLILGDCLEVMPLLGEFDAVVTDPPYELSSAGAGKSHFGMSLKKFDTDAYKNLVSGVDYDDLISGFKCDPFNAFIFCSNKQISKLMSNLERRGYSTTLLVWHKTNAAPFANGVWRGDIEYIVHAKSKGATFNGGAVDKKKVLHHPIVQDDLHPTVKPIPIITRLIKNCSDLGQTILDPFMGSGTTGVACVKLGRKFTGIELDSDYFEISCERIRKAYEQPDMFVEPPSKPLEPIQIDILQAEADNAA